MYSSFDPFYHFIVNTQVTAEVQATQGLRFPKQSCYVLDSWLDEATALQIQVYQENVVFDKVLEACDDFLIKTGQLNLCLTIDDLLSCQTCLLLFKQCIISK